MSVTNNLNTDGLGDRIAKAAQSGVVRAMMAVETQAVSLTPIEQGDLRSSVNVKPDHSPGEARAEISFNMVYAARQHEEIGWNHPRGGQAKYLSTALEQMSDEAQAIIANHLKGTL